MSVALVSTALRSRSQRISRTAARRRDRRAGECPARRAGHAPRRALELRPRHRLRSRHPRVRRRAARTRRRRRRRARRARRARGAPRAGSRLRRRRPWPALARHSASKAAWVRKRSCAGRSRRPGVSHTVVVYSSDCLAPPSPSSSGARGCGGERRDRLAERAAERRRFFGRAFAGVRGRGQEPALVRRRACAPPRAGAAAAVAGGAGPAGRRAAGRRTARRHGR